MSPNQRLPLSPRGPANFRLTRSPVGLENEPAETIKGRLCPPPRTLLSMSVGAPCPRLSQQHPSSDWQTRGALPVGPTSS